jgi:hypothetical protein
MTKATRGPLWKIFPALAWLSIGNGVGERVLIGPAGPESERMAAQAVEWLNHYRHFNS